MKIQCMRCASEFKDEFDSIKWYPNFEMASLCSPCDLAITEMCKSISKDYCAEDILWECCNNCQKIIKKGLRERMGELYHREIKYPFDKASI